MMRWWRNGARESRRQEKMLQKSLRGITSVNGVKNISLGVNPLLTSHTPVWRSRLMVAGLALGFIGLSVRAAYIHTAEYIEERRLMVQWWADYLDANREKHVTPYDYAHRAEQNANVVPIKRA